jgi:hypothetical protein
MHGPAPSEGEAYKLGIVVWRRFSCNVIAFDGLSVLSQLTLLAMEYRGSTQREKLYSQLARLTGLQHLSAPRALQADGGNVLPPTPKRHTLHMCSLAAWPPRNGMCGWARCSHVTPLKGFCHAAKRTGAFSAGLSSGLQDRTGSATG